MKKFLSSLLIIFATMCALPAFADDPCKNLVESIQHGGISSDIAYIYATQNGNPSTPYQSHSFWEGPAALAKVEPNTTYTFSAESTASYWVVSFYSNMQDITYKSLAIDNIHYSLHNPSNTGNPTFTTPTGARYAVISLVDGSTNDFTFGNLQLERGSTATTYQPYNPLCATCDGTVVVENGESRCVEIKIATTAYNDAQFAPVEAALETAVTTIKDVVANTIVQADAIQNLQNTKQTMPDASGTNGTCPKFRQCLLVETEDGAPQWFQIADPVYDFVTAMKNNKVNSSGVTIYSGFAANGKNNPSSRYYKGYPAMRLKTSDASSSVNTRQFSSTLLNGTNGGQYKTLGDQEWAVTWDGNETGTPNSFLPGVIYGTSRCVKPSEAPTTNHAAKVNPGTDGWTTIENSDALNDLENIDEYGYCYCKMTGVGLDGMITPVRDSSQAPWVFYYAYDSAAGDCARLCAYGCAHDVYGGASFRNSIMGWAVE